jgi:hypothetical protein
MFTLLICFTGTILCTTLLSIFVPLISTVIGLVSGMGVNVMEAFQAICDQIPGFIETFTAATSACAPSA